MKPRLLLFCSLLVLTRLNAQDDIGYATIKPGSTIRDVLQMNEIFQYPKFITGTVFFRDNTKSVALMNYNSLTDQMLFMNEKGDTLAVDEENTIRFIVLDKDTFYFHDGYLRLIAGSGTVKLVERHVWELADIRKIGSHDREAKTFAVTSYRTLDANGKTSNLVLNENLILRRKPEYFFGNSYNEFAKADKKNLLSFFPKKEKELSAFIKQMQVNFTRKADLENILRFLGTYKEL